MASTEVEAARLLLRRQDVAERRLQRLTKSADLNKARLQEELQMCGEEIDAVEKSKAVDMIEQLERLAAVEGALTDDVEKLQLHSADLQRQMHDIRLIRTFLSKGGVFDCLLLVSFGSRTRFIE